MSDLFTEALKDSQKLREIAEQDAKKAIVEELTPYIREMIAKEVSNPQDFFFEQEEEEVEEEEVATQQSVTQQPATVAPAVTTATATTTDPSTDLGTLGDQDLTAPVTATGEEVVSATVPDEEGKITVDFEDLFIDDGSVTLDQSQLDKLTPVQATGEENLLTEPVAAETETGMEATPGVPPVAQEEETELNLPTENISYKDYNLVYGNISERIDYALYSGELTGIKKETLKQRLFDLLEAVDNMKNNGVLSPKQARLQENKLEFLFLKLKEAGLHNSYFMNNNNNNKETVMKSLKEFAATLFEEEQSLAHDAQSSGDTGLHVDDEYSKHAADVSGIDPELGGRKDVGVAGDSSSTSNPGDDSWEDGEPVVDEENQDKTVTRSMKENAPEADPDENDDIAEGAAGFGDTDEDPKTSGLAAESVVYEIDAKEIAEAIRDVRKESIKKKYRKLAEASDGEENKSWEDGEPEGGEDESHDNLKEGMDMAEMMYEDEDEDFGVEDESDLVLSIDLPPEVEEELAALGLDEDDLDVDVQVNLDNLEDDDEVEIIDDEEDEDEEEMELDSDDEDDEDDEDEVGSSAEEDVMLADEQNLAMESKFKRSLRRQKLLERKLVRAAKLLKSKEKELNESKKQLAETNVFTAKAVYYSKFLHRSLKENTLNEKVLQQIVEHLDKGKTVAETKAIYKKIERQLNEHASASRKLDGSSSKVTKPGSANLTEGKAPQAGRNPNSQSSDRWKLLAGINRKN